MPRSKRSAQHVDISHKLNSSNNQYILRVYKSIDDPNNVYLLTEPFDETLYDYADRVKKSGMKCVEQSIVIQIISDVVKGLLSMHMLRPPTALRDLHVSLRNADSDV